MFRNDPRGSEPWDIKHDRFLVDNPSVSRRAFIRLQWILCGVSIFLAVDALVMGNKLLGLAAVLGIVTTVYTVRLFRRRPPG